MSVICRPVTPSDLPSIVALDHRCLGGLWSEATYSREVVSPNSDLLLLEADALETPQIVGMGCLWAILEEAHITLLAVAPRYRRQGLGRWLLAQMLQLASDRGLTHATLEVRKSNDVALALYTSLGFRVAGERPRYYADDETALILWKNNLQDPVFLRELRTHLRLQNALLPVPSANRSATSAARHEPRTEANRVIPGG